MALDNRRVRVLKSNRHPDAAGAVGLAIYLGKREISPARADSKLRQFAGAYRIIGQTLADRFRVAGRVFLEEELEPVDSPESVIRPSAGQ